MKSYFKNVRGFSFVFFIWIISACNNTRHRVPSEEDGKKTSYNIFEKTFNFRSHNINLYRLKKILLIQYEKNSKFNRILRIDTLEVQAYSFEENGVGNKDTSWNFYFRYPIEDSIVNIYNYDYELRLIDVSDKRFRYSNIVIGDRKVYNGDFHYIDSFSCNGVAVKDTYGSNILGIW